jgi:phosphopantothenoylcysteine decarboxylase/phosphopantothenate--cysteine ligase
MVIKMDFFKGKNILIGVTGGVAVYKAVALCSALRKAGANLRIILTQNAQRFVTKLTFESVSGFPVYTSMWDKENNEIDHISLKDFADFTIIVPATANIIGKAACGICDDLLSTVIMGLKTPVFIIPAMNTDMYENIILQENLNKLKDRGFLCMEPSTGNLACGVSGKGKLPEYNDVLKFVEDNLNKNTEGKNKKILITIGATREYFDSARFLSNPSTGKMGCAIIDELIDRGFDVIAVCGHIMQKINPVAVCIEVESAIEMLEKVNENIKDVIAFISRFAGKLKKENSDLNNIRFVKNPDILKTVSDNYNEILMVGFAAETDDLLKNGWKKMNGKKLDMLILNDISRKDIGFASDSNEIIIFEKGKDEPELIKKSSKNIIASVIVKKIIKKLK